jgi:hypothetical protein
MIRTHPRQTAPCLTDPSGSHVAGLGRSSVIDVADVAKRQRPLRPHAQVRRRTCAARTRRPCTKRCGQIAANVAQQRWALSERHCRKQIATWGHPHKKVILREGRRDGGTEGERQEGTSREADRQHRSQKPTSNVLKLCRTENDEPRQVGVDEEAGSDPAVSGGIEGSCGGQPSTGVPTK